MPGFSQFFLEWLVFCIDFPLKGPVDPTIQTCLRDVENADFGLPKLVSLDLRWKAGCLGDDTLGETNAYVCPSFGG